MPKWTPDITVSKNLPPSQVVFKLSAPAEAIQWLQGPNSQAATLALTAALCAVFEVSSGTPTRLRVLRDETWTLQAVTTAPGLAVAQPSPEMVRGALMAAVAVAMAFTSGRTQIEVYGSQAAEQ